MRQSGNNRIPNLDLCHFCLFNHLLVVLFKRPSPAVPNGFILHSKEKSFYMVASSIDESNDWFRDIDRQCSAVQNAKGVQFDTLNAAELKKDRARVHNCQHCGSSFGKLFFNTYLYLEERLTIRSCVVQVC